MSNPDSNVRAILTCVGFDDMLALTLPNNMPRLKECLVVTSHTDLRTQALVAGIPGARCYCTDAFTRHGAKFNKGLALEEGFDVLGREGWLLLLDADIILPGDRPLPIAGLDPRGLYGARRHVLQAIHLWRPQQPWPPTRQCPLKEIVGYFQLFHAQAPAAQSRPWYELDFAHAAASDVMFSRHWPSHQKRWLPNYPVLHFGATGENWFGRVSDRLDGTDTDRAAKAQLRRQLKRQQRQLAHDRIPQLSGLAAPPPKT